MLVSAVLFVLAATCALTSASNYAVPLAVQTSPETSCIYHTHRLNFVFQLNPVLPLRSCMYEAPPNACMKVCTGTGQSAAEIVNEMIRTGLVANQTEISPDLLLSSRLGCLWMCLKQKAFEALEHFPVVAGAYWSNFWRCRRDVGDYVQLLHHKDVLEPWTPRNIVESCLGVLPFDQRACVMERCDDKYDVECKTKCEKEQERGTTKPGEGVVE
jgi:hypothetical protein